MDVRELVPAALALLLLLGAPAGAHEGGHARLRVLDERIAAGGSAADLVERAELHRLHRDWMRALEDLARAERAGPEAAAGAALVRARVLSDVGDDEGALACAERHLARRPDDLRARRLHADLLARSGRLEPAIAEYDALIERSTAFLPEAWIARARVQAALGPAGVVRALDGLDRGLAVAGQVPALFELGIELCLAAGRFDEALARLEAAGAASARRERTLARRAEILVAAGRPEEARAAAREARLAVEALSPKRRGTRAVAELETRIDAILGETETNTP